MLIVCILIGVIAMSAVATAVLYRPRDWDRALRRLVAQQRRADKRREARGNRA